MAVLPGATIGILGGGQLGRMMAMAARPMGYELAVLDPDPACSARPIVETYVQGGFDDARAAGTMAQRCAVVTLEIEKIAVATLDEVTRHAPLRPGAAVLQVIRDRAVQKQWLATRGFPVGPFRAASSREELETAFVSLGASRAFVKSCTGGYDGRGQVEIASRDDVAGAWDALGRAPVVIETALDLAHEASVLVARSPRGEVAVYPAALNHHEQRVLAWSVLPGRLDARIASRADEIARALATALGVEGLLCIELFVLHDGTLLVNELAPRPHNSFHTSEVACATSQFEQAIRAACDLPLGSTDILRPAAIVNLLGEVWLGPRPPDFAAALALPGVRLHLYGKKGARAGRKMGHLSATAATSDDAIALALRAKAALNTVL